MSFKYLFSFGGELKMNISDFVHEWKIWSQFSSLSLNWLWANSNIVIILSESDEFTFETKKNTNLSLIDLDFAKWTNWGWGEGIVNENVITNDRIFIEKLGYLYNQRIALICVNYSLYHYYHILLEIMNVECIFFVVHSRTLDSN